MSFLRAILAELRIAYVPKIGTAYRYGIEAPFAIRTVLTPLIERERYVLYECVTRDGHTFQASEPSHIFASMCKEIK